MRTLFIGLLALSAIACGNDANMPKPAAIGKVGEVLVIINNSDWDSALGDSIRSIFEKSYPMLLQNEPSFNLLQIGNSSFVPVMQKHRNILLVSISNEFTEPKLTISRDLWAAPQIVVNAVGSDISTVAKLLCDKQNAMMKLFEQAELDRQTAISIQYSEKKSFDTVKSNFGVNLHIPTGYYLMRRDSDFMWFESQTANSSVGIFVYTYPVIGDSTLTVNYLVAKRDSLLKEKVHGARDSSWMTTTDFLLPDLEVKKDKNDRQYAEMRGLWELVNDYMGGPFVSRSYLDAANRRVITVEGYIFAPRDKKRDHVRKVLGIINTFEQNRE